MEEIPGPYKFMDEDGLVQLGHGAGGALSQALVAFLTRTVELKGINGGIGLVELDDGATIPLGRLVGDREELEGYSIVVSSDGHTVDPLFFPGGDLGKLAVCGAVNDVLVMGARPLAITHALFIEEGFPVKDLKRLNDSFTGTAALAGVAVIAGDTKVMPKGTLSGCISATTAIGIVKTADVLSDAAVLPGDEIVVSGTLGDHGTALLASREGISFESSMVSDVGLLDRVVAVAKRHGPRAMKDPTRGGLATALNEFAGKSGVSIWIEEDRVPFKNATLSACEMLGLDPFEIASEGRAVIAVPGGKGEALVSELKELDEGTDAAVIGEAKGGKAGKVMVKTRIGGTRLLPLPVGELIPRVC